MLLLLCFCFASAHTTCLCAPYVSLAQALRANAPHLFRLLTLLPAAAFRCLLVHPPTQTHTPTFHHHRYKLPHIFVVENNLWAIGMNHLRATAPSAGDADPFIHKKGPAFGMPGVLVDGMDVLKVIAW